MRFSSPHIKIGLFILAINLLLHLVYVNRPRSVVFDEVHFGKFITAYCCTSENFFDIHPPHAKLFISAAAKLGGYTGGFEFKSISDSYGDVPIGWMRLLPAIWGSLIPLALFFLLLEIGAGLAAALFASLLLTFDNAFLIQGRIIALDTLLVLSVILTLYFYLRSERAQSWGRRIGFWIGAGIFSGFAVGTKFTGLVAPALLGILTLSRLTLNLKDDLFLFCRKWIWIAFGGLTTYFAGWYIHFSILRKPGWGDQFYRNKGNFFEDIVNLHRVMLRSNASISTPHGHASQAWFWPFNHHPIYYWSGTNQDIYFIGNPILWWASTLFLAGFLVHALLKKCTDIKYPAVKNRRLSLWFFLSIYLLAYIPYMTISRPLFLYHYMPPLLFALILCTLWLEDLGFFKSESLRTQRKSYFGFLGLALLGFILVVPLTFGLSKEIFWGNLIFEIFPGWR